MDLKPECSYLHFDVALNLTRQGGLLNSYLYGEEQHPTTKLIRTVFNIPPGNYHPAFFQLSPLSKNFSKFLAPSTAGKIIQFLHNKTTADPFSSADIIELTNLIQNDPGFKKKKAQAETERQTALEGLQYFIDNSAIKKEIKELQQTILDIQKQYTQIRRHEARQLRAEQNTEICPTENQQKMDEDIKKRIRTICEPLYLERKRLEELLAQKRLDFINAKLPFQNAIDKATFHEESLDSFIKLVSASFSAEVQPQGRYPRHITEQILLSVGWLSTSDEKADILSLYQEIPHCLSSIGLKNVMDTEEEYITIRGAWLKEQFSLHDYERVMREIPQSDIQVRADYFLRDPEALAFLAHSKSFYDPSVLPVISHKQISMDLPLASQEQKKSVTFPDCMESAILNFLVNALSGSAGNILNIDTLEHKLHRQGYQIHPELKAFFERYSDPSKMNEQSAHLHWINLISKAPDLEFVHQNPQYELETHFSNALKIFEYLFYSRPAPDSMRETNTQALTPYASLSSSQKLDRILELLSQEGRNLKWTPHGHTLNEKNLTLQFTINGIPKFKWEMNEDHSSLNLILNPSEDWRTGVGTALVERMKGSPSPFSNEYHEALSWLLDAWDSDQTFKALEILESKPGYSAFKESLVAKMPVETDQQKIGIIRELLKPPFISHEKLPHTRALVEKIYSQLSPQLPNQRLYHATLAEANNPLNDTVLATGSRVIYSKVNRETLASRYGEKAANKMGRSWSREMYGQQIAIGEPLLNTKNNAWALRFDEAKTKCIELNPNENQASVKDQLEKRERLLDHVRKRRDLSESQKKDELQRIHTANPIDGCYVMSKEEWDLLEEDFGYRERHFIPQIIPHPTGEYWTSSLTPSLTLDRSDQSAFYFAGNGGVVQQAKKNSTMKLVRCACNTTARSAASAQSISAKSKSW